MATTRSRRAFLALLVVPLLSVACVSPPPTPSPTAPPPAVATPPPGTPPPSGLELLVSDRQGLSAYSFKVYPGAKAPVKQLQPASDGYGLTLTLPRGYDASGATVDVAPAAWRFVADSGAVRDTPGGTAFLFAVEPAGTPQLGEVTLAVRNVRGPDSAAATYTFALVVTP